MDNKFLIKKENLNIKELVKFILEELSYKQVKELYLLLDEEIKNINEGWD